MTALPAIRVDAEWGDITRTVPCKGFAPNTAHAGKPCRDVLGTGVEIVHGACRGTGRAPAPDALRTIVLPPTVCPECAYTTSGWRAKDCAVCHTTGTVPVVWPESNQVLLVIEQYGWGDEWGDQPLGDDGMYDDRRLAGVAVADVKALEVMSTKDCPAEQHIWIAGDYAFSCDGPDSDDDNVTDWFPDGLPAVGSLALCLFNLRVLDEPVTEVRCLKPGDPWPDGCGGGCDWCGGTGNGLNGLLPTVVEVELR
jgi:hypothetical protein